MQDFDARKQFMEMRQTCKDIAEEYPESGIDDAYDYAHQQADGLHDVIYVHAAWRSVLACRECDSVVYDQAHQSLVDTCGDEIGNEGTIDDVIVRLSYWIHHTLIMDAIQTLADEEE